VPSVQVKGYRAWLMGLWWVGPGVQSTSDTRRAPRSLRVPQLHGAVAVGAAEDAWSTMMVAPMRASLSRCDAELLLQPVLPGHCYGRHEGRLCPPHHEAAPAPRHPTELQEPQADYTEQEQAGGARRRRRTVVESQSAMLVSRGMGRTGPGSGPGAAMGKVESGQRALGCSAPGAAGAGGWWGRGRSSWCRALTSGGSWCEAAALLPRIPGMGLGPRYRVAWRKETNEPR